MKHILILFPLFSFAIHTSAQDVTLLTHRADGEVTRTDATDITRITFENAEVKLSSSGERILECDEIEWPDDRLLPRIPEPGKRLYGLDMNAAGLNSQERVMMSVFQGIINRNRARVLLFHSSDSKGTWPSAHGISRKISTIQATKPFDLVSRFADELNGLVLYDTSISNHYANLAATIAGLDRLLPVTAEIRQKLIKSGIDLPVKEDLTDMTMSTPAEIYGYLYDNYWTRCNHRLLTSLRPTEPYVHDLAAASGGAVIWLDCAKAQEKALFDKFLSDMTPGKGLVIGWYVEERAGIGEVTKYGLSTVPADFYENGSVYTAVRVPVNIPSVPKMPKLENKVYVTLYISDGDNIQYCEHAMLEKYRSKSRGKIPFNWTISPALVDFSPSMLNYYYNNATENDCFASGPSGLGYTMPYNQMANKWYITSTRTFTPYIQLTNRYLEKSGLRIITIWDEINANMRHVYEQECRSLYGLTQQDWERNPKGKVLPVVQNDRLLVIPNYPCYANSIDVIADYQNRSIKNFKGKSPMFLSSQGTVWDISPDQFVGIKDKLEKLSPGNIVIVRGDHFFNLYNQANHLPFNLTLLQDMTATSSASVTDAALAADGSPSEGKIWESSTQDGKGWVELDFGEAYSISRYVVRHAEAAGMSPEYNTRDFTVEVSPDGLVWTTVGTHKANTSCLTDIDITPVEARYVRVSVADAGSDNVVRIADIEVYGSR